MKKDLIIPHVALPCVALLAIASLAAQPPAQSDPCSASSSVPGVTFTLAVKDNRSTFQQGEIVPLVLSFTSSAKDRYWADVRNYDRSGRLGIEHYCIQPDAPDPLEPYFRVGPFFGGGLGTQQQLSDKAFTADAELNEWLSPKPGHYRLYAISYRVWRPPDPDEKTPWGRASIVLRSNTVEFDVAPASPAWQAQQLSDALRLLDGTASNDEQRHAARVLRFLATEDSTRALAREFSELNQRQLFDWDLMFGLYGSPYRQLAIDAMKKEIAAPDHAITGDFLRTLVGLEISSDPAWNPPATDQHNPDVAQAFWTKYQAHVQDLLHAAAKEAVSALPAKKGPAKALTVEGVMSVSASDRELLQTLRPQLIAAWNDLPPDFQQDLIQNQWELIAGPEMLPILRKIVDEPPPQWRTMAAMSRDATLKRIYELDKNAGIELINRDLLNPKAQPSISLIRLLPADVIAKAVPPAIDRIVNGGGRELDYDLLDMYGGAGSLASIQPVFEARVGRWACDPQAKMLRYFLRVAPAYGAKQVDASLRARQSTGCYRMLLQELGTELPQAEPVAIAALDDPDPEVAQDAALAIGRWGLADAEPAVWARMEKFHREWADRADELRAVPPYRDAGSRALGLQQNLVYAACEATAWICPPEKLERLQGLALTGHQQEQIQGWIKQWRQGPPMIQPGWFPEDSPTFSILQYQALTLDQLKEKVAEFPADTQLQWQFWQPGHIAPPVSLATQEAAYEEVRAVAEKHQVTLVKANQE
jgi:hypothetical protein